MNTEIRIVAGEEKGISVEISGESYVAVCALETALGNILLETVRPGVPLERIADEVRDNLVEFFKTKRGDKAGEEKQARTNPEEMSEEEMQILVATVGELPVLHPLARQIKEQLSAALNKQISRHMIFHSGSTAVYCPVCGEQFKGKWSNYNFCQKCGQKLKQPIK